MRTVSAREANQAFSRLLRRAEAGEEVVITRRGQPVAVVGPYRPHKSPDREAEVERIVGLMRQGLALGGKRFTRDEMHER